MNYFQRIPVENIINNAVVYKKKESDAIQIGSVIELIMDGRKETMEVVAPGESDILKNKISYQSPLGQKLMGKKAGKEFVFKLGDNETKIKILEIK